MTTTTQPAAATQADTASEPRLGAADDDLSRQRARQLNGLLEQARARQAFDHRRLRIAVLPRSRSRMAWFELGDPQGTPLLCLHGLSVSGYFFNQFHAHLASQGIRAVAPCLLGGISIQEPARRVESLVDELLELLDVLAVPRCDLLGFSWGTLPQLALLARAPQRIRKAAFLGPMVPLRFLAPQDLARMKPDVRLSLRMVDRAPWLHRALMGFVCRLPISALMRQFDDEHLSAAERLALAPGSAFGRHFAHCIEECIRTGSGFFTQGWRMFLDEPGYTLADLAGVASRVDVRFYVGEQDNVHLPAVAGQLAAACAPASPASPTAPTAPTSPTSPTSMTSTTSPTAVTASDAERTGDPRAHDAHEADSVFQRVPAPGPASIWMAPGAGRVACILYIKEALTHLMSTPSRAPIETVRATTPATR